MIKNFLLMLVRHFTTFAAGDLPMDPSLEVTHSTNFAFSVSDIFNNVTSIYRNSTSQPSEASHNPELV